MSGKLRKQADEIAREGHNGWGNTMVSAAECIEAMAAEMASEIWGPAWAEYHEWKEFVPDEYRDLVSDE